VESFEDFCAAVPLWGPGAGSTVFFRDVVDACLVQRVQLSGLCYMHGSDVVLHYALCLSTHARRRNGRRVPLNTMVDLNAFILQFFSGEELWNFVFNDAGGNSIALLDTQYNVAEVTALSTNEQKMLLFPTRTIRLTSGFSFSAYRQ